jgi:clan AA aspartic protease
MITGAVTPERDAVIPVRLEDSNGNIHQARCVVDTGFTGWLTLPPSLIAALQLPWRRVGTALLADGSLTEYDVYEAWVDWDGRRIAVPVDEADSDPLVGMSMLYGYKLLIRAVDGGLVQISSL